MIYPVRQIEPTGRLASDSVERDGEECLRNAERCLRDCNYSALRGIDCSYHNGVLTLRGQVPTFYMKQVAQELASKASRVEIANCLEVTPPARGLYES
jgi:osmotically-inducible protein OsmY